MISYIQKLTDKVLDSSSQLSELSAFVYSDLIFNFDQEVRDNGLRILAINPRPGLLSIARSRKIDLHILRIASDELGDDVAISGSQKISDILTTGEVFDYVLFDSCLQYFKRPDVILMDAFNFTKEVRVVIKNYGNFKHRLHFMMHGTWDFIDIKSGIFESKVLSPFGISDFYNFCDKSHVYIKKSLYVNKKGLIKGVFSSAISPNLQLDDAFFELEKI